MPHVTLACDFGSSLSRSIYSLESPSPRPDLLLIEPNATNVPFSALQNYERYAISTVAPETAAWVSFGDKHWALGHLARTHFHAVHCLESLKIDSAVPLTLAMVGAIAERRRLPAKFSIALGILLPWSEYTDRERFEVAISTALGSFSFRGTDLQVTVEKFTCLPEGAGLFARGRVAISPGARIVNPKERSIAVLSLGYRNASILYVDRGDLAWGVTEDFGFARAIQKVQTFSSGQQRPEKLLSVICRTLRPSRKTLSALVRTTVPELRERELDALVKAVTDAREEYVAILTHWLRQKLPPGLDEILVSGGTARYIQPELGRFLKIHAPHTHVNWCDSLDERVVKTFGRPLIGNALISRLCDLYAFFYAFSNRPLPRLRELDSVELSHDTSIK